MLKRYGEKALDESAARADELAHAGDDDGGDYLAQDRGRPSPNSPTRPRPVRSTSSGQSLKGEQPIPGCWLSDGACAPDSVSDASGSFLSFAEIRNNINPR